MSQSMLCLDSRTRSTLCADNRCALHRDVTVDALPRLLNTHSTLCVDNSGALHLRCHSRCSASTHEHIHRFALTTVVLCTCDAIVDALPRLMNTCVDNSGVLHLRFHSRCSASTHEHIQSSALTTVVLCTYDVTGNTSNALR